MSVFTLMASLALDASQYDKELDESKEKADSFASKLGSGLGTAAKVGAAAVGAASTAIVGLASASTSSYAEIEQLRGGVEKLFGAEDAKTIIENANAAFATAGMSAQDYMDQVTSFSAALVGSLGGDTAKAANVADVAMRAISDNVNTFGGDISNIQNAFQGFAKQNYTMLDNLKLGYGGTKTEMERLIADANEYGKATGQASDLSIESFADIVTAIDLVQQKQNIAGTTSKEAATTVAGSVGMVKAAWANLVAGFADPDADLSTLITNLTDSAETAFGNFLPVFERALTGIGEFVTKIAPIIGEKLPQIVSDVLPTIITAGTELIGAIGQSITDNLPTLMDTATDIILQLANFLIEALPEFATAGVEIITGLGNAIGENLPELIPKAVEMITTLATSLTSPGTLNGIIEAALTIVKGLAEGIGKAIPVLLEKAPEIIGNLATAIADNLPQILQAGVDVLTSLVSGITEKLPDLIAKAQELVPAVVKEVAAKLPEILAKGWEIVQNIVSGIAEKLPDILAKGQEIVTNIISGLGEKFGELVTKGGEAVAKVGEGIKSAIDKAKQWGKDLIDNFVNGIKEKFSAVTDTLSNLGGKIKGIIGFSEPKEGPLSNFHTYAPDMMELFAKGIRDNGNLITDALNDTFDFGSSLVSAGDIGGGYGTSTRTVSINVYGAEGQDVRELAEEVSRLVNREITDGRRVWEGAYA